LEKLRDRGNLEDLYVDGMIILKSMHWNMMGRAWTGLFWLRIRTCGGLLWRQLWTLEFQKCWGLL